MTMTTQSTLGRNTPQVTARAKVLGKAQYAGDIKVAGMLHGKVLRSPYPHARIVSVDTSEALALPGVKAVLTGADAPRALWGVSHKERRILAEGVVRFCGEEVAAVAAISDEIARDALDLIRIEYEELPAVLLPEEALDEEAPNIHDGRKDNIAHEIRFERGSVDEGFARPTWFTKPPTRPMRSTRGTWSRWARSPCSTRKGAWSCGRPRNPPSSPARAWPRRWSGPCPPSA
jgi:CO/xanthine dehydrogenase Mo-binding subunit